MSSQFREMVRGIGCTNCNFIQWPQVLQLHHIDRDRKNNSLKNLAVLCPNCHRAVHHKVRGDIEVGKGKLKGTVSQHDLSKRWGFTMRTITACIKKGNVPEFGFYDRCTRYRLADIEAYERQVLARGFEQRAQQLRRAAQS